VHHLDYGVAVLKGDVTSALRSVCRSCHMDGEFTQTGKKVDLHVCNRRLDRRKTQLSRAAGNG
jgi:hypothetical protein